MSYHDGASSNFSFQQSQPGLGRGSARDPVDDRRSISSADSQNARSPLTFSEVGVVTPAQAYASAVRTGEAHDRALYYTIERRQPERKGRAGPQIVSSYPSDTRSPERGLSFAQRLYASALPDKSSTLPSNNIPVLPPLKYQPSSAPLISGASQASCGVHRETSRLTSLFDTSSEVSQFNPSDLYHSSVATHGFSSWGSTNPEASATRPPPLLPVLQIPKSSSEARLANPANPLASYTSPKNFTPRSGVQNPRPVLYQSRNISMVAQSYSTPVLNIHEALSPQGVSVDTHQDFHPPVVSVGAIPSPSPLEQQQVIPHSTSPPFLEEHERLSNLFEEVVADVAPVVIQPPAAVPQLDGLPDSSLEPPLDADHEEVPLYSLIDEQLPPPTFDDIQETSTAEVPVLHQSPPPSQSPPPFSHGSTAYAPGRAPAYSLLGQTSYSVGARKGILQDAKVPLSSITTWHPSDSSSSDPPSAVPIDFEWSNQPPPSISPIPPASTVLYDGPSMTPLPPSSSRPISASFSHSPDSQYTKTSCDPISIHKNTTSPPPLVDRRTKPTAKQNGQLFPLPLTQKRPPEDLNTISQARHDSRPHVNVAEDSNAVDTLARSMSDMMRGCSSGTHSLAYQNLSSGRQDILGTSLGIQQNIPIIPASHPSGIPNSMGSLNQETGRSEAGYLIQKTYRRPTHAKISGRVGYGIQGSGSVPTVNPPVATNISSLQYSPRTIPPLVPIPLVCSHDELQTEPSRTAGDGLVFGQFGKMVTPSTGRSYSDRPHIASVLPSRSFPCTIQPSHHPIDRDAHGLARPPGSIPPQQQKIHPLEDPMNRGDHVLPPPPPPPTALQPWNAPQMPQTSSYSQGGAKDQFHPGNKAPTSSNDLAKKFAHDALLAPSSAPAHAFYGSNQC